MVINNKIILGSLAMDLKRVALGYHRGSPKMAERFIQEVKRWQKSLDTATLPHYIYRILGDFNDLIIQGDQEQIADRALMYSTLIQNYVQKS